MRQYQIDRDHLYTAFAACRKNAFLAALELTVYAEGLGDRRTGDVGIQHSHIAAAAAQAGGKQRGDEAFAHAALAADHADDLFHMAQVVGFLQKLWGCCREGQFSPQLEQSWVAIFASLADSSFLMARGLPGVSFSIVPLFTKKVSSRARKPPSPVVYWQ